MTTAKPISQPKLRFARFSEIYSCAQVLAQSFAEDVLFGEYIHPHRHEYPDDMALFWYRPMLTEWFDWTMVFLVSTEMDKQGREIITGVALWHRMGDNGRRCGWGLAPWDPSKCSRTESRLTRSDFEMCPSFLKYSTSCQAARLLLPQTLRQKITHPTTTNLTFYPQTTHFIINLTNPPT